MKQCEFAPIGVVAGQPHIIVDCESIDGTVIALSHWPGSGSPSALKADTSTQIVFNYLDHPEYQVHCPYVTNNHFDKDGLAGIYTVLHPEQAQQHRRLLTDLAHAGDYRRYTSDAAVKLSFVSNSFESIDRSPFPPKNSYQNEDDWDADLYTNVLKITHHLLENPDRYAEYWQQEYAYFEKSREEIAKGNVTIEEHPERDLAIVRFCSDITPLKKHQLLEYRDYLIHEMAINSITTMNRILYLHESHVEFRYRYESWVDYVSYQPQPRLALDPILAILNQQENSGGQWQFHGITHPYPRLLLCGAAKSTMPLSTIESHFVDLFSPA